ncbi:hypothetical protein WJX73_006414 [Symbiochloris irregularis]|uniref:Uncharacterized protein n=1 Tax=Symbiochloris irregularis TaxID=706552 RepID=A0AAW1PZA8_9CHLO
MLSLKARAQARCNTKIACFRASRDVCSSLHGLRRQPTRGLKQRYAFEGCRSTANQAATVPDGEDWFDQVCGTYPVQPSQLQVFKDFSTTLKRAAVAFAAVAVTNIGLSLLQNPDSILQDPASVLLRITVGNFSLWADSIIVAGLLYYGAGAFQYVPEAQDSKKLAAMFQGISRLTLVLQQLGIAAAAFGAVHLMEAATIYPRILHLSALLFIAVSASRGLLLYWLARRHPQARGGFIPEMVVTVRQGEKSGAPLYERRAMRFVLGHLLSFTIPPADEGRQPLPQMTSTWEEAEQQHEKERQQGSSESDSPASYFFNRAELQLVRMCIDATHVAGIALGSQGVATAILGVACFATGNFVRAFSMVMNGVSKVFSSFLLIFGASASFDRTFVIPGCHVCNMVDGIGAGGLTDLFHKLTMFSWSLVSAQVLQLAIPWLQHSPLAHLAAAETIGPHLTQALTALQNVLTGL